MQFDESDLALFAGAEKKTEKNLISRRKKAAGVNPRPTSKHPYEKEPNASPFSFGGDSWNRTASRAARGTSCNPLPLGAGVGVSAELLAACT